MKISTLFLAGMLASAATGQTVTDNVQLTQLFRVDQAARQGKNIDWPKLSAEDEVRRQEVHRMLDAGEVRTASDYFHAALVFQHGKEPDDYLLAHVLAVNAISLGDKDARWLAAATLDRFLLSVSRPQIYGTQFVGSVPGKTNPWAQRTMNSLLLSDKSRAAACVVPLKQQQAILDEVNRTGVFGSTNIKDCP